MSVDIRCGDALAVLRTLPSESVQCCVTSPPYYGLRDYGVEGQAGLEASPEAYIANMVEIFREVRRALRSDGTLWLNIGDSYGNKNRHMIPARVALALKADTWWLRDEIVWHKPRTTPAPVTDRTVSAHEMVYLLTKSPRYFYDWAAIEEPAAYAGAVRQKGKAFRLHGHAKAALLADADKTNLYGGAGGQYITVRETRRKRSVWSISPQPYKEAHFATMPPDLASVCIKAGTRVGDTVLDPFGGAGTTGLVAERMGRSAVLIELNPAYCAIARARIDREPGLQNAMNRLAAAIERFEGALRGQEV